MTARFEGVIPLEDGEEVRLLFTNRALAEAEQALGKGVLGVAQGFADGNSGLSDIAHLLRAGMEQARREAREGGRPKSLNDAYTVLDQAGFTRVAQVVMETLAAVLSYDPTNQLPSTNGADPNE